MGHIVNPVNYRLGFSKCWNSAWSSDNTFSYISLMKSDWDIQLFFKRFFDLKILVQSGYIFSHVKIIREREKIFCIVYFYDGASIERSDNMKQLLMSKASQLFSIKNMFFVALYSFMKLYQWNSSHVRIIKNFKFNSLYFYFLKKKQLLKSRMMAKTALISEVNKIFLFFSNFFAVINPELFFSYFYSFSFNFIFKSFLFFLFNFNNIFNLSKMPLGFAFRNLFVNFYYVSKKYKLFDNCLLYYFHRKISSFFIFLRWKLFRKISFISRMLRCGYQFLSFSRYFLYYFGDNFFSYFRIKTRLIHSVKHLFKFFVNKTSVFRKTKIILKKMETIELNATILSKYISIRLRQRFQLKEALMPMLRHLSNNEFIRGFRIVCAGRFTRKEIALYDLRTYSSVPFSGVASRLDYALSEVVLKYSICGIKVWLHKYHLPEREYGIEAIGMHFMLPPPVQENFFEALGFVEKIIKVPMILHSVQKEYLSVAKRQKSKSKSSLRTFIRFSTRFGPSYDFFFMTHFSFSKNFRLSDHKNLIIANVTRKLSKF